MLSQKVLWSTLENPVYAGINPEKWTQGKPVKRKFPCLVSTKLFNKADQGKMVISEVDGEIAIHRRQPAAHQLKKGVKNPEFPYKKVYVPTLRQTATRKRLTWSAWWMLSGLSLRSARA